MKRVFLTLLVLFITSGLCMAQVRQGNFNQRGNASQEIQTDGLAAAHPSLPIGSKARVTNAASGKEIEVTITGRIPASSDRVIDLSPGAALALDLGFGGPVIVSVPTTPKVAQDAPTPVPEPVPPPEPEVAEAEPQPEPEPVVIAAIPEPEPEPAPPPEPVAAAPAPQPELPAPRQESSPVNITIYNYVITPESQQPKQEQPPKEKTSNADLDYLAWLTLMAMEAREASKTPPSPPPAPPAPPPAPVVHAPPHQAHHPLPAATEVQIIPGIPDPNSGRLFHLQVGAFSTVDSALQAFQYVKSAGFDPILEQAGAIYRVLAVGVPAQSVYYAAQRLGTFGFKQVIVRE